MKSLKKFTAVALIGVLAFSMVGCGSKKELTNAPAKYVADTNLNEPGVFPVCKEKITLTVGVSKNANVMDYETNLYTKALEEKMNCDIKFVYLPASAAEAKQKIELMIAADGEDLPDVIAGIAFDDAAVLRYGSRGFLQPLNNYYENSSYYIKNMMEKEPDLKKMLTMADGNIYVVPRYQKLGQNEFGFRMWIYEPWLEKLGLEEPKTLDDFYNVLKAFKEKDPNGNKIADEIPLMGAKNGFESQFVDFIAAAFQPIAIYDDYLYPENGNIKAGYVQPEYKEALKYINKLYEEGLISTSAFTQEAQQAQQTVQNPNGIQVGCFTSMAPTYLLNSDDRKNGYDIIAPLTQNDGTGYIAYAPSKPENMFVVTKNCKHPEAAFRMADIMMSEEMSIWNRFGKPGTDWVEPQENDKGMFESMGYAAKIKPVLSWGVLQNSHWMQNAPAYRGYELGFATVDTGSNIYETRIAEHLAQYQEKKPAEYISKIIYTEDELKKISEIQQNITTYRKECVASFIIGDMDIEKEWQAYLDEMKTIGVDELVDIVQTAYDRMNEE